MQRRIKKGCKYRHFKGGIYEVIDFAMNSETEEVMVIYRALYGEKQLWTRPLSMFESEVDHEKYPTAAQKYRFEEINEGENYGR